MSTKLEIPNINDIIELYNAGMSMNQLSKKFGISRATLIDRFKSLDVYLRTQSESEALKWSQMSETARKRQVQKAHEACRGRFISTGEKIKRAKSAYENAFKRGLFENEIMDAIKKRGFTPLNQFSFGIYNIDIAIHELPVFIEIQTSNHSSLRRPKLLKRTKHILNSEKFLIYIIINQSKNPICIDLIADKIIAYFDILSSDESILGKYAMIGRDGDGLPT